MLVSIALTEADKNFLLKKYAKMLEEFGKIDNVLDGYQGETPLKTVIETLNKRQILFDFLDTVMMQLNAKNVFMRNVQDFSAACEG